MALLPDFSNTIEREWQDSRAAESTNAGNRPLGPGYVLAEACSILMHSADH